MNTQIRNKKIINLVICLFFIFFMSCTDNRASTVTVPQGGAKSASGTFQITIQLTKTIVGVNETFDITMHATTHDPTNCSFTEGDWSFNYTATSKISASAGQTTRTVDAGDAFTTLGVHFTGITAVKPGLAAITGTFGVAKATGSKCPAPGETFSASTNIQIVGE